RSASARTRQRAISAIIVTCCPSPILGIEFDVPGDLPLPPIPVREQALLVVEELFPRLRREFEIRPFHDGIDWAGLLAQPAVNALRHVDVVARRAPRAIVPP